MKFSLFSGRNESRRGSARRKPSFGASPGRGKRLGFESLEDRRLLAIDALGQAGVDSFSRLDVNRDHHVTPVDALWVINDLNANGARAVGNAAVAGLRTASDSTGASSTDPLDVNGDFMITPLDALLIINQLNEGIEPQMQIRLDVTDLSGNPIVQINQGDSFQLRAYVTDLRTNPPPTGVFAAYTDVTFDSTRASANGAIIHAVDYTSAPSGSTATAGLIDETGGADGLTPLGPTERLLFTVPMLATGVGAVNFVADPADIMPAHESLLFGGAGVPTNEIMYGSTSLLVLPPPGASLSISDVSMAEGNSGTTAFNFTVSLSEASSQEVTVQYATAADTAAAGIDYLSKSATLIFDPGQLSKTVTIDVNGDLLFENNETFFVNLSNASGAPISKSQGLGTIENDDAVPALSIDSPSGVTENAGVTPIVFTVSLSTISSVDTSVHFATANGTAAAGQDYVARPDTILTIPAGQLTASISVSLQDDALDEANEAFVVNLSSPLGATIAGGTGTGTILDNDPSPSVSIADASRIEPASGTVAMQFTVSLSAASGQTITAPFSTAADTATADVDYVSANSSVVFNPGETSKTISVLVKSDASIEPNETFFVNLGAPTNASIGDGQAVGTIIDALAGKKVQIRLETTDLAGNPLTMVEGATPFLLKGFVDDLRQVPDGVFAAYLDVLFNSNLVVVNGPITYGGDYPNIHSGNTSTQGLIDEVGATSTDVLLGAGERLLFSVQVLGVGGGTATFNPESADVTPVHDVLLYGEATPTAVDDILFFGTSIDITAPEQLTIDSPMIVEGDSGSQNLVFTVTLSAPSPQQVTVNFATEDGTATAGADFQTTVGALTFTPGQTTKTISVPVNGDVLSEVDETFFVRLSAATGAVVLVGADRGTGTITDNDPPPQLSISDVSLPEGNSGITSFDFTVTLSEVSGEQVTVQYATAPGTAAAGSDYATKSGSLVFDPGQTSKTVTIDVNGDVLFENDETFFVNLSNANNASVSKPQGLGTIANDDATPTLSIDSPSALIENAGITPIVFTVSLSAVSGKDTTVHFATADGTATAGQDYDARPDTILTIPAGQTIATISVNLRDDALDESVETFAVNLSMPSGATLANGTGTGTILDSDPAPSVSIADASRTEPANATAAMQFTVSLSAASGQTIMVPFSTADGSATAGLDYQSFGGSLLFNPGETTKTIDVPINSDVNTESNETFFVNLGAPSNATIADGQAVGTIFDNFASEQVQIRLEVTDLSGNPLSIVEGGEPFLLRGFVEDMRGVPSGVFAAYLDVLFDPALVAIGSAITIGADYPNIHAGNTSTPGLIDEVGGTSTQTELGGGERLLFSVPVFGIGGGIATFNAESADVSPAHDVLLYGINTPVGTNHVVYIGDSVEITPPRLATIDSPMIVEGNSGAQNMVFTVTLSSTSTDPVTVNFATEDGTAAVGADFQTTSGFLTFDPGQTTKTISVPVNGDTLSEADETFFVRLTGATGAVIPFGGERGTGTIKDNDPLPTLSIDDASAFEGASNAVFTAHLSVASGQEVRVNFTTVAQSATAGVDYQPAAGTLIIPAGQTSGAITVDVLADQLTENPETFALNLSGPIGAVLGDNQAIGTIRDLAFSSLSGYVYGDVNDDGVKDAATERGFGGVLLTLTGTTLLGATVNIELRTNPDGSYHFVNLVPGVYQIAQTQPGTLVDGKDTLGSLGGVGGNDVFTAITLAPGVDGLNYNFGETGVVPGLLDLDNYFASSGGNG